MVVIYNRIKTLVNKGRTANAIYLVFCTVFGTVPHDILISKLDTLICRMDYFVCEELAGWLHSECCVQWLTIRVQTGGEWHSSGIGIGISSSRCFLLT